MNTTVCDAKTLNIAAHTLLIGCGTQVMSYSLHPDDRSRLSRASRNIPTGRDHRSGLRPPGFCCGLFREQEGGRAGFRAFEAGPAGRRL